MASYYGGGFEEWVRDSLLGDVPEDKIQRILRLLAPYKTVINERLDLDFDPEEHSWRDYRNSLWELIPDSFQMAVDAILREVRTRFERIKCSESR